MNKKPILKENKYFCCHCNELLELLYQEEALNFYEIKLYSNGDLYYELKDTEALDSNCIICNSCMNELNVTEEEIKDILKKNQGM